MFKKIINLIKILIYNLLSTKYKNIIMEIISNIKYLTYYYNSTVKLNKNKKIRIESLLKFNSKPLISIIFFNYNKLNYISLTSIFSILKQEYSNWELIIINNSSSKSNFFKIFFNDLILNKVF